MAEGESVEGFSYIRAREHRGNVRAHAAYVPRSMQIDFNR